MIDESLEFIVGQLKAYLQSRFPDEENIIMGSPASTDALAMADAADKIVVSLVNVEREPVAANTSQTVRMQRGKPARASQPLNINLTLLLSANYEKNYAGGLKMLSLVMRYLQAHPLFTRQNAPALPVPLERLAVEWHDLNLESLNNLWSVMGGSYRPSVVYKLRMLVIEDDWLGDDLPVITGADVSV